ncbi:MAG: hypothetical protein ACO331_11565 [Prochlorothrix sp.]
MGLATGWILWGLQSASTASSPLSALNPSAPSEFDPNGAGSSATSRSGAIPRPEDFSRSLQVPLPEDTVWLEPLRTPIGTTPETGSIEPGANLAAANLPEVDSLTADFPEKLQSSPAPGTSGPVAATIGSAGVLRVGNQTEHPVRLALLQRSDSETAQGVTAQGVTTQGVTTQGTTPPGIIPAVAPGLDRPVSTQPLSPHPTEPFHWDFAPGEGWVQGLILSLPQGDLSLKPGDVLVAFAQDGSHRYWGPFVVGETDLPYWHPEHQEWQLLLRPDFP